jgi:hypothetical protein
MHDAIRDWLKALAVLCAANVSKAELSGKLNAYVPMLAQDFDRGAFSPASLAAVARQCKFFPSYAELAEALAPWWRENRPPQRAIASDQSATVKQREIERECRGSWDGITPEQIRAKVRELNGNPTRDTLGRFLTGAVAKHAPEHLRLLPPQWLKAYQELPEVAEQREVSLRRAALEIRPETRKGPPIGD